MKFTLDGTEWFLSDGHDFGYYISYEGATKERPHRLVGANDQALIAWKQWVKQGGKEAPLKLTHEQAFDEVIVTRGEALAWATRPADILRDAIEEMRAELAQLRDDVQIAAEERDVYGDAPFLDWIR